MALVSLTLSLVQLLIMQVEVEAEQILVSQPQVAGAVAVLLLIQQSVLQELLIQVVVAVA